MPRPSPLRTAFAAALLVSTSHAAVAQGPALQGLGGRPAAAQAAADGTLDPEVTPQIRSVLADSQRVYDRLQAVMKLTTPAELKQYDVIKDYLDVFVIGVDLTRPIRFDVLTGGAETTYRMFVPVANFKKFWNDNLDPLGIPVRQYRDRKDLYKLGGGRNDAYAGQMLYDPNARGGYAAIADNVKDIPAGMPEPVGRVQPLLAAGYDAAVQLQNKPDGADAVAARHAHYAAQKEDILGRLKRDTNESATDFGVRRYFAGMQFDETERLYAEAQDLVAGLTVFERQLEARMALRIEPLPETPLAASIDAIGKEPSRFAGVPVSENAATTGRIHLPLDEFRKENFLGLSQRLREAELEGLQADKAADAEQKRASAEFINGLFDRVDEGLREGVIDGFVEMARPAGGRYTLVGGLKSADGTKWAPLIELLPKTRRAANVKMNVGEHAGVKFHELTLTREEHPDYFELFGSGRLLAGTSQDAIWYAAGPDAEAAIKKAIDAAAAGGQPSDVAVSFRGELLPWVRIADRRLGTQGYDEIRDMAIAAFTDREGRIDLHLTRKESAVEGEIVADRGLLRFVGKYLADFSAENLAE